MKIRRHSEAQVLRILRELDGGKPMSLLPGIMGVSRATIQRWKRGVGE